MPDQWPELLDLFACNVDADKLEETHAESVAVAEKTIKDLARKGITARKVAVDVHDLKEWCALQERPLDGSARAEYALANLPDENEWAGSLSVGR